MGVSPQYKLWSRIVIGLACALGLLVALMIWASIEFINEENAEGNENLARDIGIYIACVLGGLVTVVMMFLACTVNQPQFLQAFAMAAAVMAIVFLVTSALQVNAGNNSPEDRLFLAFGFMIGILLFVSCSAAFRLSKIRDYDPEATD